MRELCTNDLSDMLPNIPYLTPGTDKYETRRTTYCASNTAVPRAIVCPRNAEEVAVVVRSARESQTPLSVRSGGHDLHGRSVVHDGFCVDMRDIDYVRIATDRKTAVIGGGVCFNKLLTDLHKEGLVTPHGSVPSIGYVGWATCGGYGCNSTSFGLGVDQIVEAEVVNDRGQIVQADEEMLKGIRGAGGNFGIITSLRIKVYEVESTLAGLLVFDSSKGISQAFKELMLKLQDLESQESIPSQVVFQPMIINHPEAGRSLCTSYVWSSNDHEKGRKTLEELISKLPIAVLMNTITQMSPPEWAHLLDRSFPKSVWGGSEAVSFDRFSPRVLDVIGEHLERMPTDPGTCFCLHLLAPRCPSINNPALAQGSCFNPEARQPHVLVEIVGSALSRESMESCGEWARSMRIALFESGEAMKGSYVSLTGVGAMSLDDVYGEHLTLVRRLKQKYDPDGVFRFAVPRLLD